MTELQKLARAVASAREVAHHAKLELAAATTQATALTAAAKQAKAAVKTARKQAKAAKHAAKSAKALAATAAQVFNKAAKKALKLEHTFGELRRQRQPTKEKTRAASSKNPARPAVQKPKSVKPLAAASVDDPTAVPAVTPAS